MTFQYMLRLMRRADLRRHQAELAVARLPVIEVPEPPEICPKYPVCENTNYSVSSNTRRSFDINARMHEIASLLSRESDTSSAFFRTDDGRGDRPLGILIQDQLSLTSAELTDGSQMALLSNSDCDSGLCDCAH